MSMALCIIGDELVDTDEDVDCYDDEFYPGQCVCKHHRIEREPMERADADTNPRL